MSDLLAASPGLHRRNLISNLSPVQRIAGLASLCILQNT